MYEKILTNAFDKNRIKTYCQNFGIILLPSYHIKSPTIQTNVLLPPSLNHDPQMIFLLASMASILCPKMIFLLHFVMLKIGRNKTTTSNLQMIPKQSSYWPQFLSQNDLVAKLNNSEQ